MTLRPGWLLWADWCRATGRTSLDVSGEALDAFARQVQGDHRSAIRATVRETGMVWPFADEPYDPWKAAEVGLLGLDDSLRRCPRAGWPVGYAGRRDAWLLVVTRGLRLPRRATLALRGRDVDVSSPDGGIRVAGVPLETGEDPATCHACVATRWLRCLVQEDKWGRSAVREMLMSSRDNPDHACSDGDPLPRLAGHLVLAPAIDQHGWAEMYRPMSPRAVTSVIADRCALGTQAWLEDPERPPRPAATGDWVEISHEHLEEVCAAADEVNARIKALLDETSQALTRIAG